jgi:hypothetical protein
VKPYLDDGDVTVWHGDCLEVMRAMPEASVDAIVTDPPAAISFMSRQWDSNRGGRRQWVAWMAEVMAEALRVAKPGAYAFVWALPRTAHWTAWALEDAGWEVRDCVVHLFGSGFPKSLDVSKAIDKRPGVMRHAEFAEHLRERMAACGYTNTFDVAERVVGRRTGAVANWQKYQWPEAKWWPTLRDLLGLDDSWGPIIAEAERAKTGERAGNELIYAPGSGLAAANKTIDVTAPATSEAARWQGWGTALKPAAEFWWLCRRPLAERTVAAQVLSTGTGALNVDGCRLPGEVQPRPSGYGGDKINQLNARPRGTMSVPNDAGRWPPNVALDEQAAALLDAAVGELAKAWSAPRQNASSDNGYHPPHALGAESRPAGTAPHIYGDTGGPSRFFYTAKADAAERRGSSHPTVKPISLMRWLVKLVTPPGGTVLDCFAGSGTTLEAARAEGFRAIGIEREAEYLPDIARRLAQLSLLGSL